jgi:hypothetical protein
VNTGYFAVHPNVGGAFNSVNEPHDAGKHPVAFRFRTLSALRGLASHITVDVEGLADTQGYIDEFIDVESGAINIPRGTLEPAVRRGMLFSPGILTQGTYP